MLSHNKGTTPRVLIHNNKNSFERELLFSDGTDIQHVGLSEEGDFIFVQTTQEFSLYNSLTGGLVWSFRHQNTLRGPGRFKAPEPLWSEDGSKLVFVVPGRTHDTLYSLSLIDYTIDGPAPLKLGKGVKEIAHFRLGRPRELELQREGKLVQVSLNFGEDKLFYLGR